MSTQDPRQIDGRWLDFYTLLSIPLDADIETLRREIGKKYAEATSNYDHRDLTQRHYYQAMVEQVLPQCRRILLDKRLRALYDEQCRLHRDNDPEALDYVEFMAELKNPGSVEKARAAKNAKNQAARASLPARDAADPEDAPIPEKLREEMDRAQSVMQAVKTGLALDLLPVTTVKSTDTGTRARTRVLKPGDDLSPQPEPIVNSRSGTRRKEASVPPASVPHVMQSREARPVKMRDEFFVAPLVEPAPSGARGAQAVEEASRAFDEAFVKVAGTQPYLESTTLTTPEAVAEARRSRREAQDEALKTAHVSTTTISNGRSGQPRTAASRLTVEEPAPTSRMGWFSGHTRAISPTGMHLLTAIVAVMLTFTIQYFSNAPATAISGERVPLIVSYASELRPFLEAAKTEFDKTDDGKTIEVILQPQDSRAGMRQALGLEGTPPDVWIPSETLWSRSYNQVAASHGRSVISSATPIALTPLVLVARADHAALLKKRFPNHRVPSWEALRVAVAEGAPGRLGLADPKKSGSGAIVRYFMAREWCKQHNVAWNAAAMKNPQLWKWMASFEENVPATGDMTADMVKDMVLGTRGLYWWTVGYESDALYWMGKGKPVEIFYLPRTNFADHPFCHVSRKDAHPQARAARLIFERFLRSRQAQQTLLQTGFRPTEIALTSNLENNPFRQPAFKERGLQLTGYPLDERLDYRIINSLNVQWDKRFSS